MIYPAGKCAIYKNKYKFTNQVKSEKYDISSEMCNPGNEQETRELIAKCAKGNQHPRDKISNREKERRNSNLK